jgi:hypothetical protein
MISRGLALAAVGLWAAEMRVDLTWRSGQMRPVRAVKDALERERELSTLAGDLVVFTFLSFP